MQITRQLKSESKKLKNVRPITGNCKHFLIDRIAQLKSLTPRVNYSLVMDSSGPDSSYLEDDLLDQHNADKENDNKTTVILLSCLLGVTLFCLILVLVYFCRRCIKEWNATPGAEEPLADDLESPAQNNAPVAASNSPQPEPLNHV